MWNNIGRRLQVLSKIVCYAGIAIYAIFGVITMTQNFIAGLITLALGCLISWIGSWTLYGLGVAAERAESKI